MYITNKNERGPGIFSQSALSVLGAICIRFENTYTGKLVQDFVCTCVFWIIAIPSIGSDDGFLPFFFFFLFFFLFRFFYCHLMCFFFSLVFSFATWNGGFPLFLLFTTCGQPLQRHTLDYAIRMPLWLENCWVFLGVMCLVC
ncbi:hypothetical protein HDV63DRAFT_43455 [Trichoderma sp. SZMC 28014]